MKGAVGLSILLVFVISVVAAVPLTSKTEHHEYCIVGSGPGGVQLGIFMARGKDDFVILERGPKSGMFFEKYPRHRTLISINKVYTGNSNVENNLRHDWNSLVVDEDKMLFKHWSKDYFPHADTIPKYLNTVSHHYGLDKYTKYNTTVTRVSKVKEGKGKFQLVLNGKKENTMTCDKLIMATGLSKNNVGDFSEKAPNIPGIELIEDYRYPLVCPRGSAFVGTLVRTRGVDE